jgi:hypothetical protein
LKDVAGIAGAIVNDNYPAHSFSNLQPLVGHANVSQTFFQVIAGLFSRIDPEPGRFIHLKAGVITQNRNIPSAIDLSKIKFTPSSPGNGWIDQDLQLLKFKITHSQVKEELQTIASKKSVIYLLETPSQMPFWQLHGMRDLCRIDLDHQRKITGFSKVRFVSL